MEFESHFAHRDAALTRLNSFLPRAGEAYAKQRNYDRGPENRSNVSGLSPFLSRRLVAEAEVLRAVLSQHSAAASEKFNQEVLWRSYWKAWLEMRPWVWQEYVASLEKVESGLTKVERANLDRALEGATGIPAFDFWRSELRETGYLHNHARMWFASVWVFTLNLPWQLGAKLFLSELLDGDSASNTLSWRWVAGLHTPGKNYIARKENIDKYTEGRFPSSARYTLNENPTPKAEPTDSLEPIRPPNPVAAPTGRLGFLMHAEDLCPENTELSLAPFVDTAVWSPEPGWKRKNAAPRVREWDRFAVQDAKIRWQKARNETCSFTEVGSTEELMAWAQERKVDALVSPKAFIGCTNDSLLSSLQPLSIPLFWGTRLYDKTLQPFATGGFFAFKKGMPVVLKQILSQGNSLEKIEYFKAERAQKGRSK